MVVRFRLGSAFSPTRPSNTGGFGPFDALLLATARQAGCSIALSEDMHDGAKLDGIVVRNPFGQRTLAEDLRPLLGLT